MMELLVSGETLRIKVTGLWNACTEKYTMPPYSGKMTLAWKTAPFTQIMENQNKCIYV